MIFLNGHLAGSYPRGDSTILTFDVHLLVSRQELCVIERVLFRIILVFLKENPSLVEAHEMSKSLNLP